MIRTLATLATLATSVAIAATSIVFSTGPADATPHGLTVSKHGVVLHSSLAHCTEEDGSSGPLPCTWNVGDGDGNGVGLAYWIGRNHHVHYVWSPSPIGARWQWVSPRLADRLPGTRNWERCAVRFGDTTRIKCADGHRISS